MYGDVSEVRLGFFMCRFCPPVIGFVLDAPRMPGMFDRSYYGEFLFTKLIPDILTTGLFTFRTMFWFWFMVGGGIIPGLCWAVPY